LHQYVPDLQSKAADISTEACQYKVQFSVGGDPASAPTIMRGVVRFWERSPSRRMDAVRRLVIRAEEQAWVVMAGNGQLHYGGENNFREKHAISSMFPRDGGAFDFE